MEQALIALPFDLMNLAFESQADADRFRPPLRAGPEVSEELSFSKAAIALHGEPEVRDLEVTNASLDVLLDLFQNRFDSRRAGAIPTWSPAAPPSHHTIPVDEQLRTNLAQALGTVGQGEVAERQGHEQPSQAQQRVRRAAGYVQGQKARQ